MQKGQGFARVRAFASSANRNSFLFQILLFVATKDKMDLKTGTHFLNGLNMNVLTQKYRRPILASNLISDELSFYEFLLFYTFFT